jgi:hypothetical protein
MPVMGGLAMIEYSELQAHAEPRVNRLVVFDAPRLKSGFGTPNDNSESLS